MSEQVVIYIESVTGTVAEVHARTAVAVVRVSPTKPKGKGRLEAAETRDLYTVTRMNSAICLVQRVCECTLEKQLNCLTRNEGSTKWKGA